MEPIAHGRAVLFPGQGSQSADMRATVERHAPELLLLVRAAVHEDPFERIGDGTRFVQPAIFCASLAGWKRLGRPDADFLAGHSLGELAALVAAGSLSPEDGVKLVVERGRLMQEAAETGADGGMLAVRGGRDAVAALAARAQVTVANDNSPEQGVLSGAAPALELAAAEAGRSGLRAKRLPVNGAFHSPAMAPARERFAAALAGVRFRPPAVPVLSCVTAAPFDDPRRRLAEALTSPVRWVEVLQAMRRAGVGRFLETGPGKVLAGLVRRTLDDVEVATPEEALHA